jgi:CMP-N,N'-diacetyllegionaminic acid synthase
MKGSCIGIIPARGGSKRIPNKNLCTLGNKPLITYTIEAALHAKRIDAVIVTTDHGDIARIASDAGTEVQYPRPPHLCTDTAATVDVIRHCVRMREEKHDICDTVVVLQPTSPFRTADHIDQALEFFLEQSADTLTSVSRVRDHPYWLWKEENHELHPYLSMQHITTGRQDLPDYVIENGAIYIVKRSVLFSMGIYGDTIIPFSMGPVESVDIDEPLDLLWAEFLIAKGIFPQDAEI